MSYGKFIIIYYSSPFMGDFFILVQKLVHMYMIYDARFELRIGILFDIFLCYAGNFVELGTADIVINGEENQLKSGSKKCNSDQYDKTMTGDDSFYESHRLNLCKHFAINYFGKAIRGGKTFKSIAYSCDNHKHIRSWNECKTKKQQLDFFPLNADYLFGYLSFGCNFFFHLKHHHDFNILFLD